MGPVYIKHFQVLNGVMLKLLHHMLVSYMVYRVFSSGISVCCILLTA